MAKPKKNSIEASEPVSPLAKALIDALQGPLAKARTPGKISIDFADPFTVPLSPEAVKREDERMKNASPLVKSVMNLLNGPGETIERLAFEEDPTQNNVYQSLYRTKIRLLPDEVLKRIAIQDDLVATICMARSNQLSAFGRPQPDRFSTGFKIEPEPGYMERFKTDEEKKAFQERIAKLETLLLTCGSTSGYEDQDSMSFGQFLYISARNALVFGRIATEAIYKDTTDGKKAFHSFRPIDAGTIYRAAPQKEAADAVRKQAFHYLQQLKNKDLEPERYQNDEYAWVQVVQGRPVQAFTAKECLVHNFYPVTDVELYGYPLTPLDTIIAAVTTHINITNHNKLYFQSGRASRGMIVVKSDDADEAIIKHIRQQFQASINSVGNAWRMPIFNVGTDDDINWFPIDNSSRDMEFQYLSDTNARVILSAFQMSPEEIPGYAHLSRGTNNQALSESNNEYKLEAHRDVGIRPLLAQFQNFVNERLLPLLDEELSHVCSVKFVGLDVETAEKESVQIQNNMAVHMTMDEVLEKVEKKPIGKEWGGQFLLNPQWQAVIDKYVPVGAIMEHFFNMKGAAQDPRFQYIRDPFFFQMLEMQAQQQAAQMQAQQPQGPDDQGGPGGGQPQDGGPQDDQGQQDAGAQPQQGGDDQKSVEDQPEDLTRSLDQLAGLLSKSEEQLPPGKRRLLAQQRKFVQRTLQAFEAESRIALKDILAVADKHVPAKKKG